MHVISSALDLLTQGSRLLLPHVSTLLKYLSGVVRNTDRLKKKKFRAQVAKELNILSKSVKTYSIVHIQVLFFFLCMQDVFPYVHYSLSHQKHLRMC